jgi:hypothetical protein
VDPKNRDSFYSSELLAVFTFLSILAGNYPAAINTVAEFFLYG